MLYGFDVGGTKIAFCVYDHELNCLFEDQTPTPHDYASFITIISDMVRQADTKFGVNPSSFTYSPLCMSSILTILATLLFWKVGV